MNINYIEKILKIQEDLVLVTIIKIEGSSPRHVGTKMLLSKNKILKGTIGGGPGEFLAIKKSLEVFKNKKNDFLNINMLGKNINSSEMICSGRSKLFFQYINKDKKVFFTKILKLLKKDKKICIVTNIKSNSMNLLEEKDDKIFFKKQIISKSVFFENEFLFFDLIVPTNKIFIFGAGYVGKAIYDFINKLDFDVYVFDDRKKFANKKRFPLAKKIIVNSFEKIFNIYNFDLYSYIIVVTRGHQYDAVCLRNILNKKYFYLGCIGSKNKIKTINEPLLKEGFSKDKIKNIFAPIGIDIKAETPEEIAISIISQIILIKNSRK